MQVNEFLQLGLEEAFFLQHALHCLKIVTDEVRVSCLYLVRIIL